MKASSHVWWVHHRNGWFRVIRMLALAKKCCRRVCFLILAGLVWILNLRSSTVCPCRDREHSWKVMIFCGLPWLVDFTCSSFLRVENLRFCQQNELFFVDFRRSSLDAGPESSLSEILQSERSFCVDLRRSSFLRVQNLRFCQQNEVFESAQNTRKGMPWFWRRCTTGSKNARRPRFAST